jgi:hypothetical protein
MHREPASRLPGFRGGRHSSAHQQAPIQPHPSACRGRPPAARARPTHVVIFPSPGKTTGAGRVGCRSAQVPRPPTPRGGLQGGKGGLLRPPWTRMRCCIHDSLAGPSTSAWGQGSG